MERSSEGSAWAVAAWILVVAMAAVVLGWLLFTVAPLLAVLAGVAWLGYWAFRRKPRHVPGDQSRAHEKHSRPKYG